ncbi:MAG TPA: hypothetical protein VMC85_02175 [Desulfomonilaceae bacterium]|nr:hypothetical protein [Desulfomonilaceae bacterium]
MGVPQDEKDLLLGAYYRFAAIFTWTPQEDEIARERFKKWLDFDHLLDKTEIVPKLSRAYSLVGARTILVIGLSKNMEGLHHYCSEVIFNTNIKANFYHAVDVDELKDYI